jgi:Helicase HerA, central domain
VDESERWSYRFRPIAARPSADQLRDFQARLRRALRAAHGLGIRLRLAWHSGPTGEVELGVSSSVGVRWVQFGLSAAYESGQWRSPGTSRLGREATLRLEFESGCRSELPFPTSMEESPWCEHVLGELGGIPPGIRIDWDLLPDPAVPSHEDRTGGTPREEETDVRVTTLPERTLRDRQESRRIALRWQVRGSISTDSQPESLEAVWRVARLIEFVSHLDGANRLVGVVARRRGSTSGRFVVLSEPELGGLFPPPSSVVLATRPQVAPGHPCLWLGRDLRGSSVGLPFHPEKGRHLVVLGETGMGKSSLLIRLAWQAARWGSVILLDPVGDTARTYLAGLRERPAGTVRWVSPTAPALTLNLLREVASNGGGKVAQRERLLGDVVGALRRVRAGHYAESSYWGPRLEEMLFQAIRAASYWPGASLAVAEKLLTPEGFPPHAVPEVARDAVGDIRRRIDHAPLDGDGARRLLSEITRSEVLREMLDAESPTWSVHEALEAGRVTVVSGEAPRVGESAARYLLAVVLALVWNAVLVREPPSKTFLILDEVQWYAHDSVAEMLRLGRRFNLHVWAVTQSLQSLPEIVRDAVVTNSADLVLFRGDPSDVRDVSRWIPQVAPDRIMRMPRGEAAVLIDKGVDTRWIHLTPPHPGGLDPSRFRPAVAETFFPFPPNEPPVRDTRRPSLTEGRSDGLPTGAEGSFSAALRSFLNSGSNGTEITVHLRDLRSLCSSDSAEASRAVRSGGRLLSLRGVIVSVGRDERGKCWVLSRERLEGFLSSPPTVLGPEPHDDRTRAPTREQDHAETS